MHIYSQSAQTWIMQFNLQITAYLPIHCKHSPDGATPNWGSRHPIAAYYSFIYPQRDEGELISTTYPSVSWQNIHLITLVVFLTLYTITTNCWHTSSAVGKISRFEVAESTTRDDVKRVDMTQNVILLYCLFIPAWCTVTTTHSPTIDTDITTHSDYLIDILVSVGKNSARFTEAIKVSELSVCWW